VRRVAPPGTPTAPAIARAPARTSSGDAPPSAEPAPIATQPKRPVLRPAAAAVGGALLWLGRGSFRVVAAVVRGTGRAIFAIARGLGRLVVVVARGIGRVFSRAGARGEKAAKQFARRPRHSRWRAYAFGWYALIVAGTFAAQAYTDNALGAYVKVQHVVLPSATMIFVRNDSPRPWGHPRVTLNGTYTFEGDDLKPGGFLTISVDKFAVYDNGRSEHAPKDVQPRKVRIECDRGTFETELTQ
jgi:hypothetical protein